MFWGSWLGLLTPRHGGRPDKTRQLPVSLNQSERAVMRELCVCRGTLTSKGGALQLNIITSGPGSYIPLYYYSYIAY